MRLRHEIAAEIARSRREIEAGSVRLSSWKKGVLWGRILGLSWSAGIDPEHPAPYAPRPNRKKKETA